MLTEIQLLESSLVVSSSSLILFIGFLSLSSLSRRLCLVLVPSAEDLRQFDDVGITGVVKVVGNGDSDDLGVDSGTTAPPIETTIPPRSYLKHPGHTCAVAAFDGHTHTYL